MSWWVKQSNTPYVVGYLSQYFERLHKMKAKVRKNSLWVMSQTRISIFSFFLIKTKTNCPGFQMFELRVQLCQTSWICNLPVEKHDIFQPTKLYETIYHFSILLFPYLSISLHNTGLVLRILLEEQNSIPISNMVSRVSSLG